MDSILNSVKKMLGITSDYTSFDVDIIAHINSVFFTLSQLGVKEADGFSISDSNDEWDDFMTESPLRKAIELYIYTKVRLLFDTPTSSIVVDVINKTIAEQEWRIKTEVDNLSNTN